MLFAKFHLVVWAKGDGRGTRADAGSPEAGVSPGSGEAAGPGGREKGRPEMYLKAEPTRPARGLDGERGQ